MFRRAPPIARPPPWNAVLCDVFTAVRPGEAEAFRSQDASTIAAAHRWRY